MKSSTYLAADPASAGAARRFVADVLAPAASEPCIEVTVLLTSEAVTNAIVHAGSVIELVVDLRRGRVRVEVVDASPDPPVLCPPADDSTSGRGLALIDSLATAWGVEPRPDDGKLVWFEVAV